MYGWVCDLVVVLLDWEAEVLVKIIFLIAILCGLTFPSVRITLAALLESTSDYLYESAKKEKTFIPYWLRKVKED